MTAPNPKVGDKVVYAGERTEHPTWAQRADCVSIVVSEEDGHGLLACWADWEDDCWLAPADRLRVVERATYTPVEANDG